MRKTTVLIVDDSQLIRDVLTDILSGDSRIEVMGTAIDPYDARQKVKDLDPDVITLDVEMPKMNGVAFLKNLMRLRPTPVVMISTLTSEGSQITLEALEIGAIDFIEKPHDLGAAMDEYREVIVSKVLAASRVSKAKLELFQSRLSRTNEPEKTEHRSVHKTVAPKVNPGNNKPASAFAAIGGSTGSLEALKTLLEQIKFTGKETMLVTVHLPGRFTASYADRLNGVLPVTVSEAKPDEPILEGHIYIAPGGKHLEVKKAGASFRCHVTDEDPVNLHKPSVDVLFDSVAKLGSNTAIGVILTGMGRDGAEGLKRMRQVGFQTYAQDEATSVVWGMPGASYEIGAVDKANVRSLIKLGHMVDGYFNG